VTWEGEDNDSALFVPEGGGGGGPTATLDLTEQRCVNGVMQTRTHTLTFTGSVSSTPWS
jgi:hypothetical protein